MSLKQSIKNILEPKLKQIHQGYYPKDELKTLAKEGLFAAFLDKKALKDKKALFKACESLAELSSTCLNTGFCAWCQYALIYYLFNSENKALKEKYLPLLSKGELLGGTGLSNAAKTMAGIEKNLLQAKRTKGGFIINGSLPWVSNLSQNAVLAVLFETGGESAVGLVEFNHLKHNPHLNFIALQGSATLGLKFENYFLKDEFIIAKDGKKFFQKIIQGFLLLQCAMALGSLKASLSLMKKAKNVEFMKIKPQDIEKKLESFKQKLEKACKNPYKKSAKPIFKLKFKLANEALNTANLAMLYQGSNAFLANSAASKNLLESLFIALVTPSIKHMAKILALKA